LEGQGLPRPLAAGFTGLRIHFVVGVVDVIVDVAVVGVVLQSCTAVESGWMGEFYLGKSTINGFIAGKM
jgi:hypothetical protein